MKQIKELTKYKKDSLQDEMYVKVAEHYGEDSPEAISILKALEKDAKEVQDWNYKTIDMDFGKNRPWGKLSGIENRRQSVTAIRDDKNISYLLVAMDVYREIRKELKSRSEKDRFVWNMNRMGYTSQQIAVRIKVSRQAVDKRIKRLQGQVLSIIETTLNNLEDDGSFLTSKIMNADPLFAKNFKRKFLLSDPKEMNTRNKGVGHFVGFPDITMQFDSQMNIESLEERLDNYEILYICEICGYRVDECNCDPEKDTAATIS